MKKEKHVALKLKSLPVKRLGERRKYELLENTIISYGYGWSDNFTMVEVPAGFVCDFLSIPRLFYPIMIPDGLFQKAGLLHDYLYRCRIKRKTADKIFLLTMKTLPSESPKWMTNIIARLFYLAVRLFGSVAYDNYSTFGKKTVEVKVYNHRMRAFVKTTL